MSMYRRPLIRFIDPFQSSDMLEMRWNDGTDQALKPCCEQVRPSDSVAQLQAFEQVALDCFGPKDDEEQA